MRISRIRNAFKVIRAYIQMSLHLVPPEIPALCSLIHQCTLQVRSEMIALAELLKTRNVRYGMEIGTCRGGTLFLLCHFATPDATVISMDLPGGAFGGGYRWFQVPVFRRFAQRHQRLHLLRMDSHAAASKEAVATILNGNRLDYLLIDGDHSYAGVKRDFEMYAPLVRPEGLILFHDIVPHPPQRNCGVHDFWQEIKPQYKHQEFVQSWQQQWAGIGVLQV